jgi:hypothetical protein
MVEEALFAVVKERRQLNKVQMGGRHKHEYSLSGMLTCGHCHDIGMTGISRHEKTKTMGERVYSFYTCNRRHNRKRYGGIKCELPPLAAADLDATVASWVTDIMLSPERLRAAWQQNTEESTAKMRPLLDIVEANEQKVAALRDERQRLINAYAAGILSLDDIAPNKTDIDRLIAEYEAASTALREDIAAQTPNEVEFATIEEFAQELAFGAEEGLDNPAALHDLYRALNTRVTVTYEEGRHWADISCYLGRRRLPTASPIPPCSGNDTA